MNAEKTIVNDYKKWLLYSFDNQDFAKHYDLFTTLKTAKSFGATTVEESENAGLKVYLIFHANVSEGLQVTEEQRKSFIRYLVENYFHSEDVDEMMLSKKQQSEKDKNHNYLSPANHHYTTEKPDYKVKPHPKETTYYNVKLAISAIFYMAVACFLIYGFLTDLSLLISLLIIVPVVLLFLLMNKVLKGIFVGIIRGSSIRVTKDQFPDIYAIIEEQRIQLKLEESPDVYITTGHFNAFVTKFSRAHILMIYSEVIETALKGNYDVLKYVTAHELCHIKQRHLAKEKYLFPSRIIPFLSLAYSRACEFTCDRTGYHFSPKGSIEGVLIMTMGKEIYSQSNIELHINDAIENEGFWSWLSEKFLTHPHPYKRLIQIKDYSKYHNGVN